jgi:uncharacterized membrane protein YhaH (DUF805 family)
MNPPASVNPFALFRQSFQWGGRFTGRELFVVVFSMLLLAVGILFLHILLVAEPGTVSHAALRLSRPAWLILALATIAGAIVRRLHDLGLPAGLALLTLVPYLNVAFFFYVLFAPGIEGAETPRARLSVSSLVAAIAVALGCGVLYALSTPGLKASREGANESAAIGDLRSLASAQVRYQARNGGAFEGRWECLARPADCLPGDSGPRLVDADALRSPKRGYAREFRTGRPAARPPAISATSTSGFAIVARPVSATDGRRTFCTDTSGRICALPGQPAAGVVETTAAPDGVRCAPACIDLR